MKHGKQGKKGKKAGVAGLTAAAVVAAALFFSGDKLGLGNGVGLQEPASSQSVSSENQQSVAEESSRMESAPSSASAVSEEPKDPNHIVIQIDENRVFVDNDEVANADELRKLVEQKYADGVVFELTETNSILATHEWVIESFKELDIPLTGVLD